MTRDEALALYHPIRASVRRILSAAVPVCNQSDLMRAAKPFGLWANGKIAPVSQQRWLRFTRLRAVRLLYSLTKGQQAIREMTQSMRDATGNLPLFLSSSPITAFRLYETRQTACGSCLRLAGA
jgi:hypothetical protein